jgi:hypothetical protein
MTSFALVLVTALCAAGVVQASNNVWIQSYYPNAECSGAPTSAERSTLFDGVAACGFKPCFKFSEGLWAENTCAPYHSLGAERVLVCNQISQGIVETAEEEQWWTYPLNTCVVQGGFSFELSNCIVTGSITEGETGWIERRFWSNVMDCSGAPNLVQNLSLSVCDTTVSPNSVFYQCGTPTGGAGVTTTRFIVNGTTAPALSSTTVVPVLATAAVSVLVTALF